MPVSVRFFLLLCSLLCWSALPQSQAAVYYSFPPAQKKHAQERVKRPKRWHLFKRKKIKTTKRQKHAPNDKTMAIITTIMVGILYLAGLIGCIIGIFYFNAFGLYVLFTICGLINIVGFIINITTYLHDAASSITMALVWVMIQLIVVGLLAGINGLFIAGIGVLLFGITFILNIIEASN